LQINKEKGQALVEFLTPEDASAALYFDGSFFSGSILKVRRPKDFVEAAVRMTILPSLSQFPHFFIPFLLVACFILSVESIEVQIIASWFCLEEVFLLLICQVFSLKHCFIGLINVFWVVM